MKLLGKIIAGLVILVVVAVVGLYAFTKYYLTQEKLRALVEPQVTEAIGRDIKIGKLEFDLFTGLVVENFSVAENAKFGKAPFISVNSLVLKYDLLSLLTGKLAIHEISLNQPDINIIKDKTGRFNFQDIAQRFEAPEAGSPEPTEPSPISFAVSQVNLRKGKFTYKDLAAGQTHVVDQIDVSAKDLSLDQPVPFTVALQLNRIPIKVEGRFSAKTQAGQAMVIVDQASAQTLAAMMPPNGPATLTGGQFSLKVKADYNPGRPITAQGELTGKKIGLVGQDKKALLDGDDLGLVFDLTVDPKTQKANIKALKATLGKNNLSVAGWASAKACDLTIDLPGQELGLVNRFVPDPKAGIASGAAGLNLRVNTSDFTQKLHFSLSAFTDDLVTSQNKDLPPLDIKTALAGVVWLKKNQLDLDKISLQGPGMDLAGSGKFSQNWVNLTLKPINLDVAQVLALSPVKIPYRIAGRMSGNFNIKGKPTKPESMAVNGLIDLKKMSLEGQPFTAPVKFSGQMAVNKQTITKLALSGSIDKTNFSLTGSGKNLTVKPDLVMNIKADKADFDKLIAPPKEKKEEKKKEKKKSGEPDPINAPVNARARLFSAN